MQTSLLCVLIGAVALHLDMARSAEPPPIKLPAGLKLSLVLETNQYFLGENVLLHYRIENTGAEPFKISVGGDYRGGTRAHRFKISATDTFGKVVADPNPIQWNMGGLSPMASLAKGSNWYEQVWLMRYCRFEEPGVYTIRVFHDLGLDTQDGLNQAKTIHPNDPRQLTAVVKFVAPTEQEGRQMVAAMLKPSPYSGPTWGHKGQSMPDFSVFRHSAYLPALLEIGREKSEEAIKGIDSIYTPEATKALVNLQDDATALKPAAIDRAVLVGKYLARRLPKPPGEPPQWRMDGQELQDKIDERMRATWRPEWAQPVVDSALVLLAQTNRDAVQLACKELHSLGQKEHLPALLRTLDYAVAHTTDLYRGDHGYPEPISVCKMLAGVVEKLAAGEWILSIIPESPGKALLLARSLHSRTNDLVSWDPLAVKLLNHDLPFIRAQTLASLPGTLPARAADLIAQRMQDTDVTVQNQAFLVAEKMNRPEHREIALKVLGSAKDRWLFQAADRLARKYCARVECADIWLRRFDEKLDDPGLGRMSFYASQALWEIATGGHISGGFNDRDDLSNVKKCWSQFLLQHKDDLKAGKRFTLGDGVLTKEYLPPGMQYYPPK